MRNVLVSVLQVLAGFGMAVVVGAFLLSHIQPSLLAPKSRVVRPAPSLPKRIKLLFFTQKGCGPCESLKRQFSKPEVKKALARFDVEYVEDSEKFLEYRVYSTPTLVALGTAQPARHVGFMKAADLVKWLDGIK